MRLAMAAVLLIAAAVPAAAHTVWATGEVVSPDVATICCGKSEEHILRPDQIHAVKGGYMLDGWPDLVTYDQIQPSPDGVIRAFWYFFPGGSAGPEGGYVKPYHEIRCVFFPPDT